MAPILPPSCLRTDGWDDESPIGPVGWGGRTMPSAASQPIATTWLRGARFDLTLIGGTAAIALLSGAVVVARPDLFVIVLFLDLWLLGYQHVVATFTRIAFDADSFRKHRFLVTGLPLIVVPAVFLIGMTAGAVVITTVYFYWQAFHYTRQSYGIARAYARKQGNASLLRPKLDLALLYGLPLWGVLHRSHQDSAKFLGLDIFFVPVPSVVSQAAGVVAIGLIAWWLVTHVHQMRQGSFTASYSLYMASHVAIFVSGYVLTKNVDHGWLIVNVWHNAQYLLFVWLFNNKTFGSAPEQDDRLISALSRRENAVRYFIVPFALSTVSYAGLYALAALPPLETIAFLFLISQAINFHHYLVDGVIWKRRRPAQAPAAH